MRFDKRDVIQFIFVELLFVTYNLPEIFRSNIVGYLVGKDIAHLVGVDPASNAEIFFVVIDCIEVQAVVGEISETDAYLFVSGL